ncbi:cobalt-precorrin-5B (C(1))-methyltransferase CbiD [Pseudanabaena sp. FACHB-2040]|uniref:cobalt-precorrin-5B (C(1))-methyltransferase CbiD n=1 Tax=Pseudanabaena sp. FACHB-2040 TaxID=2692859 RepID=UPI0016888BE8|nr:cobalt-precorrin-5B (C(1))-methyltransferase CbiD [Pseudanabaena sp. FACHB-2040]MBD2260253.1 cobalt-precorrin-5B (C(1))-methyltransferase [Pseudanabaena sp. FACHB-2040]
MADPGSSNIADLRAGYTLPVFACASAIAALRHLLNATDRPSSVSINLIEPDQTADIPVEQIAALPDGSVLAITRSDPGSNLDLTRHTPIWAVVNWGPADQSERILIEGGEGIGRLREGDKAAIYRYATRLLQANLTPLLPPDKALRVTIILPEGRALAQRTSNEAFGVVEGLSLLGTGGISQPLSAPGQLEAFRQELKDKAARFDTLVFCIGENGLDLAAQMGVAPDCRVKTANWLGPLLVEAGNQGLPKVLLFGYHGKLIKLAGGIFHTHHHVADGRQEILAAHCAAAGLPPDEVRHVLASETVEAGLKHLRQLDAAWVERVYGAIATRIDQRASDYVFALSAQRLTVGSLLFDRSRRVITTSSIGNALLRETLVS